MSESYLGYILISIQIIINFKYLVGNNMNANKDTVIQFNIQINRQAILKLEYNKIIKPNKT